ncbi:MAG TPA: FAD-dependent oxidoreductase [Candidatus Binatia bacterium]|nr:FAD-dependent oxidoreductase [Candidatus Binatia bacterium]
MSFPHLFAPLRIGPVESRNRIIFGAHFTMFSEPARIWGEPGFHGERLGRYVEDRARGGAGVVIVGQTQVHPTTAYQMTNNATAWETAAIPHFERVTAPIHGHGALAFVQLAHNGGVNFGAWSKLPAWTPSGVVNSTEAPKVLERHEIAELVEYFARSAHNAAAGGFDGIEIHAAHGYLIHEFLSPRSNLRSDEYGGSLDNRMRFAVEVLEAVRAAVGSNVAVGLRLVGDEELQHERGLAADDAAEIAARFDALGLVDFLNVSVGMSGIGMVRPMYAPRLLGAYAARAVKQAVRHTPVFAVHRIVVPDEAERLLERGDADAVTLVRALIADPEWPNKARNGAAHTIRRCTGNNQGCYGNLTQNLPITCVTNPAVGRDAELGHGTLAPAKAPKHVVVVGGGPGGLEAAWVAAARGHRVTLLERAPRVGGKIRLAQMLPGREELTDFADWRAGECERRGVDVRLNTTATVDSVLALAPDAIIVATGGRATKFGTSKFFPMPVMGSEQDFVVDHEQALLAPDALGARVIIFDAVGHIEAIGLGELLATKGVDVTTVTTLPMPINLDRETMGYALPRAVRAGMRWLPNTALVGIGDRAVTLMDTLSRQIEQIAAIDTVVIRTNGVPDDALYFALKDRGPEVVRIGDAVAVRYADRAIFDGHMAGRRV